MSNQKLLGKRIKELRNKRGLTQEKLAESIGLEPGSLSSIESGRNFPSLINLEKISLVLDIELKCFFDFSHLDEMKKVKSEFINLISELNDEQVRMLYKCTKAFVL